MTKINGQIRHLSSNEKLYITGRELIPPFCIQFVVEGKGDLDQGRLSKAIKAGSQANPGSRQILQGDHWVDSLSAPPLHFIDQNEDFLCRDLDISKNTAEILVSDDQIIFRVFHGTMDAKGLQHWICDIVRAYNGNNTIGSNSNISDYEFVKAKNTVFRKSNSFNVASPVGKFPSSKNHAIKMISIAGKHHSVVSKIISCLTEENKKYRFMIPVDLRRHDSSIKTTNNFSYPLFFTSQTKIKWKQIQAWIVSAMFKNEELKVGREEAFIGIIPNKLLTMSLKLILSCMNKLNKYMVSAIISNLGEVDFSDYQLGNFKVSKVYSIPVPVPLSPLSIVTVENPESIELGISYPNNCEKSIESIIESINRAFRDVRKLEQLQIEDKNDDKESVVELFMDAVAQYPYHVALISDEQKITYKELDQLSSSIAQGLRSQGVQKNSPVAIKGRRSVETIATMIGVLKVGGYYIPIDSEYPEERINYLLEDSEAITQIDTEKLKLNTPKIKDNIVNTPGDLCYSIYTSGSTGRPKGVLIKNTSVANYLLWAQEYYGINEKTNSALFTSISFDLTVTSLLAPLISGGTVTIFAETFSHHLIGKLHQCNFFKLTPTHLDLLIELNREGNKDKCTFVVGGEKLKKSSVNRFYKQYPNGKLFNEYGPTEATVGCIVHEVKATNEVPIGLPIHGTDIYLLDDDMNEVNPHRIGEIYIGGRCLAQGYKNENNNCGKFIIHQINGRLYKSGDLAYINDDGLLVYVGRNDDQVKINGIRVELGEIENILKENENVQNCVVANQGNILCAFIVKIQTFDPNDLAHYLEKFLPKPLIPSNFVEIEHIPFTLNGKIDRTKLPFPENKITSEFNSKNEFELIWLQTLNISELNQDDNFFSLGGNSLKLIEMLYKIESKFKKNIKLEDFIEQPTYRNLFFMLERA